MQTPAYMLSECHKLTKLTMAQVSPSMIRVYLTKLSFSCPFIQYLDLSGTKSPPVKSVTQPIHQLRRNALTASSLQWSSYFPFLRKVVTSRIKQLAEHDGWDVINPAFDDEDDQEAADAEKPTYEVVKQEIDLSTAESLEESLLALDKETDINNLFLITQTKLEPERYPHATFAKKGLAGTLLTAVPTASTLLDSC